SWLRPAASRRQDPGPPRRCRARRSWLSGDAACGRISRSKYGCRG
ncbi:hypothetical protein EE612_057119, partial [Oryza sativa]